jgi:cell division protease FtsH
MPPRNAWVWLLLLLLANLFIFRLLFPGSDAALSVPYTVFKEQVSAGNVAAIYNQGQSIEGRFIEPVTYPMPSGGEGPSAAAGQRPL